MVLEKIMKDPSIISNSTRQNEDIAKYREYIGENKKIYTKRVSYWNLLNYVFQKFYYHIKSVVFNPLLWLKRNKLKEFLKNN